ncbi:phosphatase PAP2 family protein [Pontibacillus salicampi]|uniref:Phosphatase PAP2 family protein n=1 Tax=Pontibacillus salicampi TaxID=1449801 RepID=A0ABV6LM74_9BACI
MKRRSNLFIILALAIIGASYLTYAVVIDKSLWMDKWGEAILPAFHHARIRDFFTMITELGSRNGIIFFMMIFLLFLCLKRDWLGSFLLFIGVLLGNELNIFIKESTRRERPRIDGAIDALGYSFPSGHAMVSVICFGLIVYYLRRYVQSRKAVYWIGIAGFILTFLIGISRFVLEAHYISDVLAGFLFGFLFLLVVIGVDQLSRSWIESDQDIRL